MKKLTIALFVTALFTSQLFSQIKKQNAPTWIDSIDFYDGELNQDDIIDGSVILLYDNQIHIPKQEAYTRVTTQITDNVGVQNASNITLDYDPTYQSLAVHKVNVIRDGEVLDKLNIEHFQVMRRELNAEIFLYDGSMSAVLNISDVRTGDIIDYSYSVTGFNPIHKNKFSNSFYLNDIAPVGKIHVNIISKNKLQHKSFNTKIEPKINQINGLYKYKWMSTNTKKLDYEENTPLWKLLYETVFISEYKSWEEVIKWGVDIFEINEKISPELLTKINEINTAHKSHGEKIKATLNFVQNEIRYLGLEYGISGYKPFAPNTVFERRFGDCKDKSLLMVTMLNEMGIESFPMLVNTSLKKTILNILPSPKFFDHCVVKVLDGAKNEFWYDPTISNQGGEFNTTYFPDYECGLVLEKGNFEFDDIYSYFDNRVDTVEEYTLDGVGKGANLKVTTTYYESEADNIRNYFKSNSINAIKKEFEMFYSSYFFNVSSVNTPTYTDNLKENIFTLNEEYKLDSLWKPMLEKDDFLSVSFVPLSLLNTVYIPTKDTRKADLAMLYPMSKSHRIRVKLPAKWDIKKESELITSPAFYYELDINYNKQENIVDIYHFLKSQKNHIAVDEYDQYIQDINKLDKSTGYYIYAPKDYKGPTSLSTDSVTNAVSVVVKFVFILAFFIAIVLFIYWYYNKNKA